MGVQARTDRLRLIAVEQPDRFFPRQLDQRRSVEQRGHGCQHFRRRTRQRVRLRVPKGGSPVDIQSEAQIRLIDLLDRPLQGLRRFRCCQGNRAHQQPTRRRRHPGPRQRQLTAIQPLISKTLPLITGKTLKHPLTSHVSAHQHHPTGAHRIHLQAPQIHTPVAEQLNKRGANQVITEPA